MKEISLISKQRGAFVVEFAIMAVSLSIFFLFTIDVMFKVSTKGKLDRLAFSSVSIMKERTQLYDEDFSLTTAETELIYQIMAASMSRTTSDFEPLDFGMTFEAQTYDSDGKALPLITLNEGNVVCNMAQTLGQLEPSLKITTSWGRKATLYRATACYETHNYVAGVLGSGFTHVDSSAVIVGR